MILTIENISGNRHWLGFINTYNLFMRNITMVDDTSDGSEPPRTFEEELAITFHLIEKLNAALEPEEAHLMDDPPAKVYCLACGKYMTETRCLYHLRAHGCHYCHLHSDFHKPPKQSTEL